MSRVFRRSEHLAITVFLSLVMMVGCGGPAGPKIAPVSGKVTLDGVPVPEALVEFVPQQGRPSTGVTDSSGDYSLTYTQSEKGAIVGSNYRVKITTGRDEATSEGVVVQKAIPEKLPEQYNKKSTLTAEINAKPNVINFELKAK